MAETLIIGDQTDEASRCIEACKPDNYANKIANDSTLTRMANDRVRIAEWNGDLERSADLLKDFSASSPDTNQQSLHTAELITKLALMNGSYERAESTSRYLLPNIESLSDAMPKLGWQTPRDKFLKAHEEALLDRAIALWHLRRYDEAERLLRYILTEREQSSNVVEIDAAALLALCYRDTGHQGLMRATQQEMIADIWLLSYGFPSVHCAENFTCISECLRKLTV